MSPCTVLPAGTAANPRLIAAKNCCSTGVARPCPSTSADAVDGRLPSWIATYRPKSTAAFMNTVFTGSATLKWNSQSSAIPLRFHDTRAR